MIKYCENCKIKFSEEVGFCNICGARLELKKLCSHCGTVNEINSDKCSSCNKDLDERTEIKEVDENGQEIIQEVKPQKTIPKKFIIGFILIVIITFICFLIFQNVMNTIKAPNCDSYTAKQEVIDTFKEYNSQYKKINEISISSKKILNTQQEYYDRYDDKYSCSGEIVVNAYGTFLGNNNYFKYEDKNAKDIFERKGYVKLTKSVNYYSQLSNGKPYITTDESGDSAVFKKSKISFR